MAMIRDSKPDILILDVMMPKKNGYDVCNEVKSDAESKHIHVMMLTAKGGKRDLEVELSQDADEYVAKPFSPMKIVARVKELFG